jgi:magnesium transporter
MIKIFRSFGGYFEIPRVEKGCWINVANPSDLEITRLKEELFVPEDILLDILDADERPRLEYDDEWWLVIMRIPIPTANNGIPFNTVPLGIFMKDDFTVTICSAPNEVLPAEQPSLFREQFHQVNDILNFILKLFLRSANVYLRYLKQLNQQINLIEQDLEKSVRNKELNKLLKMEKCLVYFVTSLRSNEIVLTKLRNSKRNSLTEVNEDLYEDALIENKQAIDMAQIYSDIQSGMMDAFASVISNNLNVVMKQLTSISIFLMIPTLLASLFGMNVPNMLENSPWAFAGIIFLSIIASSIGVLMFRKREWF